MARWIRCAAAAWALALGALAGQERRPAYPGTLDQHPAIDYRGTPPTDVVTRLQRELSSGVATLAFEGRQGYLRALLARLDVPVESQVLLFSKTGIQHPFTDPEHPRALYFNDRVIVGYIAGAPVIELAAHDPRQGVIFQTLKQEGGPPQVARPDRCLTCHLSANSLELASSDLRTLVRETAEYLLLVDEARLAAPVEGVSGFAQAFVAGGPRDRRGRSLRELDLQTRLFRYRCSYMIYSPAFDALPDEVRAAVYGRMREILSGRDDRAVMEILDDTRKGWR